MMLGSKYALVCLKSFGDMVIAARSISMLYEEDARHIVLWIGSHHVELSQALNLDNAIEVIDLKCADVPAFYDIKDNGLVRATYSLLDAYHAFTYHKRQADVLMFDVLSWREKILATGRCAIGLDNRENNIYKNYKATFLELFGRFKDEDVRPGFGRKILIFPHGRKSFRNIPPDLIDQMASVCLMMGYDPVVYMLEGEDPVLCRVPHVMHAHRSFNNLRLAIEQACAVISADSLAAHMTTFFAKPVFVASPYNQTLHWLPPYSYENRFWGLFSEPEEMMVAFHQFLISLSEAPSEN